MKGRIAFLFSSLFSPFVVTFVTTVLLIGLHPETHSHQFKWIGIYIFFTVLIPLLYIAIQVLRKKLTDVHVAVLNQRKGPLLVALLSVISLLLALTLLHAPFILIAMTINSLVQAIIFLLISRVWKISFHIAVLSGCIAALGVLLNPWYFTLLFFVPIVGWARLQRKRHTLSQIFVAAILAFIVTGVIYISLGY